MSDGQLSALDVVTRPRDAHGRVMPHRLKLASIVAAMPWMLAHFKPVPGAYARPVRGPHGTPQLAVDCPCGERHVIEIGAGAICDCERTYLNAGTQLLVAGGPKARDAA